MVSCTTLLLLAVVLSAFLQNTQGYSPFTPEAAAEEYPQDVSVEGARSWFTTESSYYDYSEEPESGTGRTSNAPGRHTGASVHINNSLNLANMGLTQIREGFANSQCLAWLHLKGNRLRNIPSGTFQDVPNLKYLNLASNWLENIIMDQFIGLKKLETLILDGNHVGLPYTIDKDGKYRDYRTGYWSDDNIIWYNRIGNPVQAPPEKQYLTVNLNVELPALTHLYLQNNSIEEISYWGGLPMLTHLHLSDNALAKAANSLSGVRSIPSLTHLYLERNMISNFNLSKLDNISSLSLDGNEVKSICNEHCGPAALCLKDAHHLQFLSTSYNQIENIHTDAFIQSGNLIHLDLSSNRIARIQKDTFDKLSRLQFLSLDNNTLGSTSAASLTGLSSLRHLSLRHNRIGRISEGSINQLTSLEKLYLNNNRIRIIDERAFSRLLKLKELSLANNLLSILPSSWLPRNGILSQLDLSNNFLTDTKDLALHDASYLSHLNLKGNPLTSITMLSVADLSKNLTVEFCCKCEKSEISDTGHSFVPFETSTYVNDLEPIP